MKTILVTGATGSVGSKLVGELRERGVSVRAFVRDPAAAARLLGSGVELAAGDFADAASLRRALQGVDGLFLASPNHPRHVDHECAVIDAAAAAGLRRIVKLSALGAEAGSRLAFWDAQGRLEQIVRDASPAAVILRPTFYMSNLLGSAEQIRRLDRLFAPAAGARVAMIDPRDVAAVAAVALTTGGHEGQTYELTGPEALSFDRVAEELSAATGRPIAFVAVPDEAARQGLVASGIPPWLAEQLVALFALLRRGAQTRTSATVRAVTGRDPRTVAEFARDHAGLFRAMQGAPAMIAQA